ncbi:hypothetical protein C8Q80DRAFT_1274800 [Daedaleopsis nitida]|nr:hypothetical protein C8Q80DRAFT_1274800 [Daedaleopsis nitida]
MPAGIPDIAQNHGLEDGAPTGQQGVAYWQEAFRAMAMNFYQLQQQQSGIMNMVQQFLPLAAGGPIGLGATPTAVSPVYANIQVRQQVAVAPSKEWEQDIKGSWIVLPRRREDFPEVPYWRKSDWGTAPPPTPPDLGTSTRRTRGRTDMAQNINKRLQFVYTPEGKMIDGRQAEKMLEAFYKFCVHLENNGRVPGTWKKGIDPKDEADYHYWMKSQFREAQVCEGDWISDEIAIANFSHWRSKRHALGNGSTLKGKNPMLKHDNSSDTEDAPGLCSDTLYTIAPDEDELACLDSDNAIADSLHPSSQYSRERPAKRLRRLSPSPAFDDQLPRSSDSISRLHSLSPSPIPACDQDLRSPLSISPQSFFPAMSSEADLPPSLNDATLPPSRPAIFGTQGQQSGPRPRPAFRRSDDLIPVVASTPGTLSELAAQALITMSQDDSDTTMPGHSTSTSEAAPGTTSSDVLTGSDNDSTSTILASGLDSDANVSRAITVTATALGEALATSTSTSSDLTDWGEAATVPMETRNAADEPLQFPSSAAGVFKDGASLPLSLPPVTDKDYVRPSTPPYAVAARKTTNSLIDPDGTATASKGRSKAAKETSWPPSASSTQMKDRCALIWYRKEGGGTYDDFDKFYKNQIKHYPQRKKYIETDGDWLPGKSRPRKKD